MNVEPLYRGKRLGDGKWVYGCLFSHSKDTEYEGAYILYDLEPHKCGLEVLKCKVDPKTIGQYTGKDDIYGVKVFTDDIIEYSLQGPYPGPEYRIKKVGPVIFSDYCFMPLTFCVPDSIVVKGNIHDNSDLYIKKDG